MLPTLFVIIFLIPFFHSLTPKNALQRVITNMLDWFSQSNIYFNQENIRLGSFQTMETQQLTIGLPGNADLVSSVWQSYLPIAGFSTLFYVLLLFASNIPGLSKKERDLIIKRETLKAIIKADEQIFQITHIEQGYRYFLEIATRTLHADSAVVFLWDDQEKQYLPTLSTNLTQEEEQSLMFDADHTGISRMFKYQLPLVINKLKNKPFNTLFPEFITNSGIRAIILLPAASSDPPQQIFCAFYRKNDHIPKEIETLFRSLVNHISLSIKNLERLEQTRLEAIRDERRRLARDLHDSTKQKAFAALTQMGIAHRLAQDREPLFSPICTAEDLLYEAIEDLGFILQEICPKALSKNSLQTVIHSYLRQWESTNQIKTKILLEGEQSLPKEIEITLYRIIQEAFANIARHSCANQAVCQLAIDEQDIHLNIRDNGIGFDCAGDHQGMGLTSMRERLIPWSGTLKIKSRAGSGTELQITIPQPNQGNRGENYVGDNLNYHC